VLVFLPASAVRATPDGVLRTPADHQRTSAAAAHLLAAKHPIVVYLSPGDTADENRLNGAWVDPRSTIRLDQAREATVRTVTFFVDEPKGSTQLFAIDRKAPFVLPKRGAAGKRPYALGPHTLRADVELQKGRKLRLALTYTVAQTLSVAASVDAASLEHAIEAMPPGALAVRPAQGASSFSVSGDLSLNRGLVQLDHAAMSGAVEFDPGSSGSSLVNSNALGFSIFGADDIFISGNTFDGQGRRNQNVIWDEPAGNTPDGFVIRGNVFRNFYIDSGDVHSEALYVGYSTNGLIENNTFTNNGNTAHIFFTWFGSTADPATSYPRNMCVRGNTFGPTHGAFYDVNMRGEIPLAANIRVQPGADNARPEFSKSC
jgi:hypothetical protein